MTAIAARLVASGQPVIEASPGEPFVESLRRLFKPKRVADADEAFTFAEPGSAAISPSFTRGLAELLTGAGFPVDEVTLDYLKGRPFGPRAELWNRAAAQWRTLKSDPGAKFDREVKIDARSIKPQVTWGTSPEMVVTVEDRVPDPDREKDATRREGMERALQAAQEG